MVGSGLSLDKLEMALVMTAIFLAPMNYFRLSFVYVTLSDVIVVVALGVMLLRGRLPVRLFGEATYFWILSFMLLQAGLLVGSLVNGDPLSGIEGFAQYSFSMLLLPVLLCNRPLEETLLLLKVFVLSIVFIMIHGAYVVHFDPDDLRFVSGSGRLTSLVERENAAATLASLAIVIAQWLYSVRQIRFLTLCVLLVPLAYGLLLTGSNTGFALTAIGTLALAVFSGSVFNVLRILAFAAAAAFVILIWGDYFLPEIFIKRVMGALSSGDLNEAGTFSDRMSLIHEAIGIANRNILVGLGIDQYRVVSAYGAPVHNTYLLVLSEGGLLSLIGLFGLLLTGLYIGWRALSDPGMRMAGGLAITVIMMFALAMNGFAHIYARFWAVPMDLVLALGAMASSRRTVSLPRFLPVRRGNSLQSGNRPFH